MATPKIVGQDVGLVRAPELLDSPIWEDLPTDEPVEAGKPWIDGTVFSFSEGMAYFLTSDGLLLQSATGEAILQP